MKIYSIKGLRKERKPKIQFSKKICLFSMFVVMFSLILNGTLAWFYREPLSDVTIVVIGTFGGFVTSGYFVLCAYRDGSLNKNGLCVDEEKRTKQYMEKPGEVEPSI